MSPPLLPECHRPPPKLLLLLLPLLPATWCRLSGKPGDSCLAGILFLFLPLLPSLSLQYFFLADLFLSQRFCPLLSRSLRHTALLCKAPSTGNPEWSQFANSLLHSPHAQAGCSLFLAAHVLRSVRDAEAPQGTAG